MLDACNYFAEDRFARDIVRINAQTSAGTVGRPERCRLFQVQNRRKPRRCHATTVSGFTRKSVGRQPLQMRENHTQSSRSATVKRTRRRRARSKTCSWCRRARISRCSATRDRTKERNDRKTDTTRGLTDPRLFDGGDNLNESARTDFLVGTPRQNREFVAPTIIRPKRMDCDAVHSGTSTSDPHEKAEAASLRRTVWATISESLILTAEISNPLRESNRVPSSARLNFSVRPISLRPLPQDAHRVDANQLTAKGTRLCPEHAHLGLCSEGEPGSTKVANQVDLFITVDKFRRTLFGSDFGSSRAEVNRFTVDVACRVEA